MSIAASGSLVCASWLARRGTAIDAYFNRWLDAGTTWPACDLRLDMGSGISIDPHISASGSSVHAVWSNGPLFGGNRHVYYKRSIDGGATWGAEQQIDASTANAIQPVIATSGAVVHLAWADSRDGTWSFHYNRSVDAGTTWPAADVRLNTAATGLLAARPVALSATDTAVYAAWEDRRNGDTTG